MDASNLLRLIKLQNIFAPPQPSIISDDPFNGGITGNLPPPSPYESLNDIEASQPYSGIQNDAGQRFDTLMDSYPVEDPISKWRRVGGFFAGLNGGAQAGADFIHAPYDRKVVDWKNKVQPATSAMTQERLNNQGIRTAEIASDRLTETERKNKATEDINREKLKVQQDRAAVYKYKSEHPNHQFKEDDKGNIIALDPAGGSGFIVTDADGQPIKSSKLSDVDKANLQLTNAKELIDARVAGQKDVEATRQANRQTNIATQGEQSRQTKQTVPGKAAGSATGELPSQTKVRQYIRAREAFNTHPEWQKYIKLGAPGTNDFQIVAPSKGRFFSSGPSEEEYKKIIGFLGSNVGGETKKEEPNPPIKLQDGKDAKIKVTDPNGKVGYIPFSQWPAAEKQGYKKAY